MIARPGRGGHMPPRSSMARATRASGERNPKAQRDPLGAFELKHPASCVRRVVCDGQWVVSAGQSVT